MSMTFLRPRRSWRAEAQSSDRSAGAGEEPFLAVDVQGRETGGAGHGVTRIGVAVEQLDPIRPLHQGVVDLTAREDHAHRHGAVGQPLGGGHEVGRHAEEVGGEGRAERPKPVMTSSKMSRMPCFVQISRRRSK